MSCGRLRCVGDLSTGDSTIDGIRIDIGSEPVKTAQLHQSIEDCDLDTV